MEEEKKDVETQDVGPEEEGKLLRHDLHTSLITNDRDALFSLVEERSSVDIADSLIHLSDDECILFFSIVPDTEKLGEIFSYLSIDKREALCRILPRKKLSILLTFVQNDDLADFVEDLPKALREQVLSDLPAKRRNLIVSLAKFSDDTIGSIMTTEYLSVLPETTIKEVFEKIKRIGKTLETVRTIFVTDKGNKLLGTERLEDMMFEDEEKSISEVMTKDFPFISPIADREEAIPICQKYDLPVLPVVSKNGDMLGIITFDDVLDVVEAENTEDVLKQAGVQPGKDSYLETKSFRLARSYVLWLIILLIINTFSGMVISNFENALLTFPVLLSFIPALGDSCGDAGDQTSSMVTRAIATGEIDDHNWYKAVLKEFASGLITALIVAAFNFCWVLLELNTPILNVTPEMEDTFVVMFGSVLNGQLVIAAIVSIAFFFGIAVAKLLASLLPLLAKKVHLDPAVMSGPLIASIMDILTLLLYFSIAMAIIDGIDPGAITPALSLFA